MAVARNAKLTPAANECRMRKEAKERISFIALVAWDREARLDARRRQLVSSRLYAGDFVAFQSQIRYGQHHLSARPIDRAQGSMLR